MNTITTSIFCFFVLIQVVFVIQIGNDLNEKAWQIGELNSRVINLEEDIIALKGVEDVKI